MRKIIITVVSVILSIFVLASCGGGNNASVNEAELSKLPENYPLESAPLYGMCEIVSVTNKGSDSYFSYEIVFNSTQQYEDIIEYYSEFFSDAITNDFGIAYSILHVPDSTGYMCNMSIYSSVTKGEKGECTVMITVSDY